MNNLFYNAAVAGGLFVAKKQNLTGQEKWSLS
jgi:hypothetical protein